MSRLGRLAAVVAFVLASLSQPLALDACAVSCEAARAARVPAVAAPCHHTTSCASQISQPTSPGSTAVDQASVPPVASATLVVPDVHPYYWGGAADRPPHVRLLTAAPLPLRL